MYQTMTALAGLGLLVSASMWLALHAVSSANLAVLPVNCRKRLSWWRVNARGVYLVSAAVALATIALHLQVLTTA
ncbi:MAG: hypothetical protein JWM76_4014 [Pseudonocardiales bacterium]|nr:hypothetical protein [Pseudonocardiales bacterium]